MSEHVFLAKSAIEAFIKERRVIEPSKDLSKELLEKRAGVFVSIEKDVSGKMVLRGCIGTYLPTRINIAEETIRNAIAASVEDYRFGPVQEEELPFLSYIVYILEKPQPIKDPSELNPKQYGIIVNNIPFSYPAKDLKESLDPDPDLIYESAFDENILFKAGLLLPGLEHINTPEKQIAIACQKAGINPATEKIFIYRFKTKKYSE